MSIENEERLTEAEWRAKLESTTKVSDFDERQKKIERISSDPKPQWSAEPARDYPTTEKHYIICVKAEQANESLPEAKKIGEEYAHRFGAYLVSDRLELPVGWFRALPRGTSIEKIKEEQPALYEYFKEKKIEKF